MNDETCIKSTPLAILIESMSAHELVLAMKGIMDPTENIRREMVEQINSNPNPRAELEAKYGAGNVWNTTEFQETFSVEGFMAPFCVVTRKSDGVRGSVKFQHNPRFYFGFEIDK